jgi:hypothetical protein
MQLACGAMRFRIYDVQWLGEITLFAGFAAEETVAKAA